MLPICSLPANKMDVTVSNMSSLITEMCSALWKELGGEEKPAPVGDDVMNKLVKKKRLRRWRAAFSSSSTG